MIRTSIWLPLDLHDDLRHLAYKQRCSMAELLRIAAEAHFSKELEQVRQDPFRAERLENTAIGRKWRERRGHKRHLDRLDYDLGKVQE